MNNIRLAILLVLALVKSPNQSALAFAPSATNSLPLTDYFSIKNIQKTNKQAHKGNHNTSTRTLRVETCRSRPPFLVVCYASVSTSSTASTSIEGSHNNNNNTNARIKRAGAGLPLHPAGTIDSVTRRFQLFDPAQEGKLGGTPDLDQRITLGTQYQYWSRSDSDNNRFTTASATANRGRHSSAVIAATSAEEAEPQPPKELPLLLEDTQHWLEYLDGGGDNNTDDEAVNGGGVVPAPFAKASQPVMATVLGRGRVIGNDAPGDIQHIVLQLPDGMHYVEGQSLSVIPPNTSDDDTNTKPQFHHKPRLYSIASTRYGDLLNGKTVSLCVRRAVYVDPVTNLADDTKKGICSNFLCDCQVGDLIPVAGPVGKTMLLPKKNSSRTDIIMVATGTGIAPFRGFLHRLFVENTVAAHLYTGRAWLILGVPTTTSLLYEKEISAMQANNHHRTGQLEVSYAISREMTNALGGKLYVQDILAERITDVLERLDHGAVIYFCGLKGMMPGILTALEGACANQGLDWKQKIDGWKRNGQWHVEVY